MAKAKGLGKGLDALVGDTSLQTQGGGSVSLPISQVQPGLNQPRKQFDQDALDALAQSIREHGIIQPLTVRRLSSGYYQIIAGERRWRAAKLAGLTEVPALIIDADDRTVMELALIENLQREDLNPIEEAMGYRTLVQEYGLTQEEVAKRMGKSRPAVTNAMRLLTLSAPIQKKLREGALTSGHARAVLSAPVWAREKLAQQIEDQGLSVRQAEQLAKKYSNQKNQTRRRADEDLAPYLADLEKSLSGNLGRKVHIVHGRKKGRIELEYYDEQDLEDLLAMLGHLKGRPE